MMQKKDIYEMKADLSKLLIKNAYTKEEVIELMCAQYMGMSRGLERFLDELKEVTRRC